MRITSQAETIGGGRAIYRTLLLTELQQDIHESTVQHLSAHLFKSMFQG